MGLDRAHALELCLSERLQLVKLAADTRSADLPPQLQCWEKVLPAFAALNVARTPANMAEREVVSQPVVQRSDHSSAADLPAALVLKSH